MSKQNREGLNDAQKKFCEEYIYDFNGGRAYQSAYPNVKKEAARAAASRLLTNVNIQAYIKHLQSNLAEITGLTKYKMLKELEKIAMSSMAHLHNTWVERKAFDQLTEDQKACIQEISTQQRTDRGEDGKLRVNEYVKIKLYDKHKSIEMINKMLGYNEPEKIEHLGDGIVPLQIGKASDNK